MTSVVVTAPPRQYQRIIPNLGGHILKRIQKEPQKWLKGLKVVLYNEHTKTHNLVGLSESRLRSKLIQTENKKVSKSRVLGMLSQTRKGHHTVKKKKQKKKSWETCYPLEVLKRGKAKAKRQHCFSGEIFSTWNSKRNGKSTNVDFSPFLPPLCCNWPQELRWQLD